MVENIRKPTIISAGAVANEGMAIKIGARKHVHKRIYLLCLAAYEVYYNVGNDTDGDTLRNAVEKGHCSL